MLSMNTYFKGVLGFSGVFDLGFLLIFYIWHDVQKGSGSTLRSISFQTFTVSPSRRFPFSNILCNNSRSISFLGFYFDSSFVFTNNACFLCALCSNFTALCWLSINKNMQKPSWKRHICTEFINLIIEKNQPHKSGANIMLYNVAMKALPSSLRIFIWTYPVFFCCYIMPICNLNVFISFHKSSRYKIWNLWCHVKTCAWA